MFIAWRQPEAADWDVNTKQLVLWMHDTDAGDRLTKDRARKFDKIVVLSEWHKQNMMTLYPFIKEEKYVVIGNGVDPKRFNKKIKRNPKRVIYSSSPDRGLDVILEGIWPKVVEAVPDAELHFYYGWNNFDKFAAAYPHLVEFKKKIQSLMLATEGVVQHGRINQDQLAKAFMKSSVWLYPTYFSETYCITAIEAQLGGAIPVTNRLAALNETVVSGFDITGDVHDPNVQEVYAQAVIHVLTSKDDPELRGRIKESAPAITWDQVADAWLQIFPEGDITSDERPVRRGEKLLPAGFDQLADNPNQAAASLDS
jgi:glycosyltransferase involved in cell wall biosynthesis